MRRRVRGLAGQLLLAQTLVAFVAGLTAWLVAAGIGPPLFRTHLRRAGMGMTDPMSQHAEAAFRSTSGISVGVAVLVALAVAVLVSALLARRISGPIVRLAAAARERTAGRAPAPLPLPAASAELTDLSAAFTVMASQLQAVEATRRRLLADLAHELRTPIATLDAYLQGVTDGVVAVDEPTVTMLREQTARLSRLAEDVAAVSHAEERPDLQVREADVATLVSAAVDAARERFAARRVRLTARTDAATPTVAVDTDRIGQVLGNLLDNSLRHTPPGGEVTITARCALGSSGIEITVADTGEGIAAEHLEHVFERFYRVDRARDRAHGGSGIGLAIAKAFVQAHGGQLTAASAGTGRGATFTVTLPAAKDRVPAESQRVVDAAADG